MKTLLRIFLGISLVVGSAGAPSATPIHILSGTAVEGFRFYGFNLVGDRGFTVDLGTDQSFSGFVPSFPPSFKLQFNFPSGFLNPTPGPGQATLNGISYVMGGTNLGPVSFPFSPFTGNLAAASFTAPGVETPGFPLNADCHEPFVVCARISISVPAQLTGIFIHSDGGFLTPETFFGEGIATLALTGRPDEHGHILWSPEDRGFYRIGVSPALGDFVWRLPDGEPLQASPEPATLLLFGTTVAGLGLAWWRKRAAGHAS